jgi:hypothetical protein
VIYISKKKVYSKHLEKGIFYLHNDINGGHPSLIYEKNDKKNRYKAIQFTHVKGSDRTELKHNINSNDNRKCYVINYPIIDKRKKFGSKELTNFKVHKEDKNLINKIKRKKK